MHIQTLLLAAGSGSRFGGDKLVQPLADGRPMIVACAESLLRAGCEVLVVVRPESREISSLLTPLIDASERLRIRSCADCAQGMGHSLACGVAASRDADAWLVALGDMPFVRVETLTRISAELSAGASLVAPVLGGRRGHPVGFAGCWREHLLASHGDAGARGLLAGQAHRLTRVETDDPGVLRDLDRPADIPLS